MMNTAFLLYIIWMCNALKGVEMFIGGTLNCINHIEEIQNAVKPPLNVPSYPTVGEDEDLYENEDDSLMDGLDFMKTGNRKIAHQEIIPIRSQLSELICTKVDSFFSSYHLCGTCWKITYKEGNISVLPTNTYQGANNLEEIHLTGSKIRKIEAGAFGFLPKLTVLKIDYNNLTKITKGTFNSLINLKYLNLSHNIISFIEEESFHGSVNIEHIDLSFNRISVIPMNFFPHSKLSTFNLSHNSLSFLSDDSCSSLIHTTHLVLDHNLLMEVPSCFNAQSLAHLTLSFNSINSLNCSNIPFGIEELEISNNEIQDLPHPCRSFESIKKLDISNNNFEKLHPQYFEHFKKLEYLDISMLNIERISLKTFSYLENLKELIIKNNNITFFQKGIFQHLSWLIKLDFSGNDMSLLESGLLNGLDYLEILNGSHNKLEYLQSGVFNNLKRLKIIDLSSNNIKLLQFHIFQSLISLNFLDISSNEIETLNIKLTPSMQNELNINLDGNQFTCTFLADLFNSIKFKKIVVLKGKSFLSENINGVSCHDQISDQENSNNQDIGKELKYFFQYEFKNTSFYNFFKNFTSNGKNQNHHFEKDSMNNVNLTNSLNAQVKEFMKFENQSLQRFLEELSVIRQSKDKNDRNESSHLESLTKIFEREIENFERFENLSHQNYINKLLEITNDISLNSKQNYSAIIHDLHSINAEKLMNSKETNDTHELIKAINQFKAIFVFGIFIILAVVLFVKIWPMFRKEYQKNVNSGEENQEMVLS